ncbi:DNA starvation/stationary phase protection protein DpsA [Haloarchaeobius sp. DFWS5]|jgi:DNA-binding ferritin-like protein|uniref:DNA starvation/stationary phase protection protein DpsA n=1 Tax=Haloarchaeobius sp. DFWS5 TaxID=3446114 RepID=UPI003EBC52F4
MSTQKSVRQQADTVEHNALRIEEKKAEQIIDALNTDLAATYTLYHQVKKHHWNVEGAEFHDLHIFFGDFAHELEEAADEQAERLQALGGVPVSGMRALAEKSPVTPEDEDVYTIRASLENDIEMGGDIIETMREHIELTTNLGDHATAHMLREQLLELEEYVHHVEHYLEDDTLVQ